MKGNENYLSFYGQIDLKTSCKPNIDPGLGSVVLKKIAINTIFFKNLTFFFHGKLFSYFPQKRMPKLTTCEELESKSPLKCTCEELESKSPLKCIKSSPPTGKIPKGRRIAFRVYRRLSRRK